MIASKDFMSYMGSFKGNQVKFTSYNYDYITGLLIIK